MTQQELDALQGLCDSVSDGTIQRDGKHGNCKGYGGPGCTAHPIVGELTAAMPALIAEVRRLQERCEVAENDMEDLSDREADPCDYCQRKRKCPHPGSCPASNHRFFKWRGPAPDEPNA